MEAVVQLLTRLMDGGNAEIQDTIHEELLYAHDDAFVIQIKNLIDVVTETVQPLSRAHEQTLKQAEMQKSKLIKEPREQSRTAPATHKVRPASSYVLLERILNMLQMMCENHHTLNQNYMRNQNAHLSRGSTTKNGYNLVIKLVEFFDSCTAAILARNPPSELSGAVVCLLEQTLDTLTEFVQGPCLENQVCIVDTDFIGTARNLVNEFYWYKFSGVSYIREKIVKKKVCITLTSLLEQREDTRHHDRMWDALPLAYVKINLLVVYRDFLRIHNGQYGDDALWEKKVKVVEVEEDSEAWCCFGPQEHTSGKGSKTALLEMGFSLFILCRHLIDQDPTREKDFIPLTANKSIIDSVVDDFDAELLVHSLGLKRLSDKIATINPFGDAGEFEVDVEDYLLNPTQLDDEWIIAYSFFNKKTKSVEISMGDGKLLKCFFPMMPLCTHLSIDTQERILHEIRRNTATEKITDILHFKEEVMTEMEHLSDLHVRSAMIPLASWILSKAKVWDVLSFYLACALNILLLVAYQGPYSNGGSISSMNFPNTSEETTRALMVTSGIVLCVVSTISVIVQLFQRAPLTQRRELRKYRKERGLAYTINQGRSSVMQHNQYQDSHHNLVRGGVAPSEIADSDHASNELYIATRTFFWVITERRTGLNIILIGIGWIAILLDRYILFGFHLLWIFNHASDVEKVVLSVVRPWRALLLTFVLFVFIVYWFSLIAFAGWVSYPTESCDTLLTCFGTTFDQGFKNDGGIGGFLDSFDAAGIHVMTVDNPSWAFTIRFCFDHFFNIILMVLLLNIVFGLVIDTFSEMRAEADRRQDDMKSRCTICDLPAGQFDQVGLGFKAHVAWEHNLWSYYFFFAFLRHKDPLDYSGIESYVAEKLKDPAEAKSIWPIHRALSLKVVEVEDVEEEERNAQMGDILNQLASISRHVSILGDQFKKAQETQGRGAFVPVNELDLESEARGRSRSPP